jgi:predicted transcriptional regulator
MFRVANFMIRSGLSLLLFSSLVSVPLTAHAELPTAPAPAMPTADVLLQASLVDLADKPVSLRGLTGKVVVVVHQDRHSSEQNPALKERLSALLLRHPQQLQIVALADVGGYDFWPAKGFVKDALKSLDSGGGALVVCDWKGAVRKAYKLKQKHSTVFVLSKTLTLVRMTQGQLSTAESDQVVQAIAAELAKAGD